MKQIRQKHYKLENGIQIGIQIDKKTSFQYNRSSKARDFVQVSNRKHWRNKCITFNSSRIHKKKKIPRTLLLASNFSLHVVKCWVYCDRTPRCQAQTGSYCCFGHNGPLVLSRNSPVKNKIHHQHLESSSFPSLTLFPLFFLLILLCSVCVRAWVCVFL